MNENKQISSRARKLLPSAVWANVRWKRDGYLPYISQSKQTLVGCGFSNSTHFVGKIAAVLRTQTSALSRFCHPNKKKKKKADLRRERGGSSEPPEPPLRTGLMNKHPQHIIRKRKSSWEVIGTIPLKQRGGQNNYRSFYQWLEESF